MKCKNVKHKLSAYMDNALDPETRRLVEGHLHGCPDCGGDLAGMRRAWDLLGSLPEARPAPYLSTRVIAETFGHRTVRTRHWIEQLLLPVSAAVVAMAGIWLGTLVGRNGDATANGQKIEESAVLSYSDHFDDFPSASLSDAYFTLDTQE